MLNYFKDIDKRDHDIELPKMRHRTLAPPSETLNSHPTNIKTQQTHSLTNTHSAQQSTPQCASTFSVAPVSSSSPLYANLDLLRILAPYLQNKNGIAQHAKLINANRLLAH
jgi:hypothetical protein